MPKNRFAWHQPMAFVRRHALLFIAVGWLMFSVGLTINNDEGFFRWAGIALTVLWTSILVVEGVRTARGRRAVD